MQRGTCLMPRVSSWKSMVPERSASMSSMSLTTWSSVKRESICWMPSTNSSTSSSPEPSASISSNASRSDCPLRASARSTLFWTTATVRRRTISSSSRRGAGLPSFFRASSSCTSSSSTTMASSSRMHGARSLRWAKRERSRSTARSSSMYTDSSSSEPFLSDDGSRSAVFFSSSVWKTNAECSSRKWWSSPGNGVSAAIAANTCKRRQRQARCERGASAEQ
mmetsp:Transcript_58250/g.159849  ORF Transcript_58250/g.159849 Transcript_58250/m.159849 type:complete len:222 (-) Transcript_58250:26-691(-)